MRTLRDLGFIEANKGPTGDFHYVLLLNPSVGIENYIARVSCKRRSTDAFRTVSLILALKTTFPSYDEHLTKIERVKTSESVQAAKTSKANVASANKSIKSEKTATKLTSHPPQKGKED